MSNRKLPEPKTPIAYPKTEEELEALRVMHGKNVRPEMAGLHALNGFSPHNSASRSFMMGSHIQQHLVVDGLETPYVIAGPEYRYSQFTFSTKMPCNGRVVAVINRYNQSVGRDSIRATPERTVIFVREDNGKLDFLNICEWRSFHPHFGFRNKIHPSANRITEGSHFPKGHVFADTPANTEDGCYCVGVNLETAFFDRRATAEDGMVLAESARKKLAFSVFENRIINIGANEIPLNLYGSIEEYKIFPDIGEEIRPDGLIMVKRPYGDRTAVATMSNDDLRSIDHYFDVKCYSRESIADKSLVEDIQAGRAKASPGRVIDIIVTRNPNSSSLIPPTMARQLDKYSKAQTLYWSQLLEVSRRFEAEDRRRGGEGVVPMTPRLTGLLERARVLSGQGGTRLTGNISLELNRSPYDEYQIQFVIEHKIIPTVGFKCSDLNGGKSVIVAIRPDDEMPVDASGRRAEVVVSSSATIDRSNWGRNFGPYFAAVARNMTEWIRKELNLTKNASEEQIEVVDQKTFDRVYDRLMFLYAITSPHLYKHYTVDVTDERLRRKHVLQCVNDKVKLFMPIDNPINNVDAVLQLEKHFPQTFGPVRDKEEGADFTQSLASVRIQPALWMLLEKIGDQGSATNIPRLQHHGLLASLTREDRHTLPYRPGPARIIGEMEAMIYLFYARTPRAIAELHDMSNNPQTMRRVGYRLLREETPTNIDKLVDRKEISYEGGRPLQFLQHFMATQGAWIAFMPEEETFKLGMSDILVAREL